MSFLKLLLFLDIPLNFGVQHSFEFSASDSLSPPSNKVCFVSESVHSQPPWCPTPT